MSPPAEYVAMRKSVKELLSEIGAFLVDATHAQNDESDSPPEAGRRRSFDAQLQRFWRAYGLLRGSADETLTVAVLALTKSGKSTLLNALTSTECLPMNNVPETARICKIVHTAQPTAPRDALRAPAPEPWLQEPGAAPPVHGERAIRARLAELNSAVRGHGHHVEAHVGEEHVLHIHASIAALREYDGAGLPALALLDTPGPNEAGEEGLRHQVDRLLDSVDAVVYLLDYTKLKTAEEADMFRRLKQINPQLVKRLSQRLFFVVNKADTVDVSEGMDADDTRAYVASLVTQQLGGEGFQLQPEQVLLVSARNALLARLVLSGKASEDVARRFSRLAFGMASSSRALPTEAQVGEAAVTLLEQSGMLAMEAQVLTFLYAHSAGVKLMATLDNLARLLWEMGNVAESVRGCLRLNVSELQVQTDSLRGKLTATLGQFDDVLAGTDTLQSEVTDEIRAHLQSLRVRLFHHILQTLEARESTISAASSSSMAAAQRVPRRWQLLRDKFVSMFTSSTGEGVPSAKSRSREELQKLLQELHEGLMTQIQVEVGEFWSVLEACTNARHAALVRQLNGALATLSKQVEDAVTTGLNVTLQPVDISMPIPSAEQFHSDLNDLISKGISSSQEKHLRVGQRQVEEKVMRWREGVCQWGAYWETVPRTRTVVETYDVTMYELNPNQISSHFIELVDAAIESTSKALSSYVRTFVRSQLDAARASIEEYSERYLSAMTSALETSHRGVESRAAALATVERHVAVLAELRAKTAALAGKTELLVPQLQDAQPYDELSDEELQNLGGGAEPVAPEAAGSSAPVEPAAPGAADADAATPSPPDLVPLAAAAPETVAVPPSAALSPLQAILARYEALELARADSDEEEDEYEAEGLEDYDAEEDDEQEDEDDEDVSQEQEEEEDKDEDPESEEEEDEEDAGSESCSDDCPSIPDSMEDDDSSDIALSDSFSAAPGSSPLAPGSYSERPSAAASERGEGGVSVGGSFMSCGGEAQAPSAGAAVLPLAADSDNVVGASSVDDELVPDVDESVVDDHSVAQGAAVPDAPAVPAQEPVAAGGGDGPVDGCVDGNTATDSSAGPFDYSTGFVRAMSTSLMVAAAEEEAAAAADEWTLLDEDGSSASDEQPQCASP